MIRIHNILNKTFEYKDLKDAFDLALKLKKQTEDEIDLLYEEQWRLREKICIVLALIFKRD